MLESRIYFEVVIQTGVNRRTVRTVQYNIPTYVE